MKHKSVWNYECEDTPPVQSTNSLIPLLHNTKHSIDLINHIPSFATLAQHIHTPIKPHHPHIFPNTDQDFFAQPNDPPAPHHKIQRTFHSRRTKLVILLSAVSKLTDSPGKELEESRIVFSVQAKSCKKLY